MLRAYALYDPSVGYCQGLSYIAAMLVLRMQEEQAFWTFIALMQGAASSSFRPAPLQECYSRGLPLLKQQLVNFDGLIAGIMPKLDKHLRCEGASSTMYAASWFNTLMAYCMSYEHVLRIWDIYMLEGTKIVYRVGLALLESLQKGLLRCSFEDLLPALHDLPRSSPLLMQEPDVLVKASLRISVGGKLAAIANQGARC